MSPTKSSESPRKQPFMDAQIDSSTSQNMSISSPAGSTGRTSAVDEKGSPDSTNCKPAADQAMAVTFEDCGKLQHILLDYGYYSCLPRTVDVPGGKL